VLFRFLPRNSKAGDFPISYLAFLPVLSVSTRGSNFMPWNNQNGGGWQSGGGGRGPWGQGSGGGGQQTPDLEDLLRRGQDRFKNFLPGQLGGGGVLILIFLLALAWMASGIYRVNTDEEGVVTRFGAWTKDPKRPGLHYHLPYPIESVRLVAVEKVNKINIGFNETQSQRQLRRTDNPQESLMLTGDENILSIDFIVLWKIDNASAYLFNVQNPEGTVKAASESAMREIVGASERLAIQTENRRVIEEQVKARVQQILDDYGTGIVIREIKLQDVEPPEQVIEAFRDVQRARADRETYRNQAEAYQNELIPRARGEAQQIRQQANAYKEQTIAEALGEAARFVSVYEQYRVAKDVTRQRIFLETMEKVFADMNKVIVDSKSGEGVVPYLPLPELQRSQSSANAGDQQ
jgi:membrane protease subunit HflK